MGLEAISFEFRTEIRRGSLYPPIPPGIKSEHVFTVDSDTLKIYAEPKLAGRTFDLVSGRFEAPRTDVTRDKKNRCTIHVKVVGRAWTIFKGVPGSPAGAGDDIDYDFVVVLDTEKKQGRITGSHDGYPSYRVRMQKKIVYDFEEISIERLAPPKDQTVDKAFTN
ncbi:MAG: hypothetical protein AB1898_15775 [Acidobacteriota bacterium]